jgi:hypothetical protein
MMPRSPLTSMPAIAAMMLLTLAACKKDSGQSSGNQFTSLLFDASSPAAREALATAVNFRLTESNYDQWEQAQRFLDALPRSALASASGAQGNAIDRAVETLEASPRARTAIERTGLSVRDFVLETIALAQATEAATGKSFAGVRVPPENVQFVQRYQARFQQARANERSTPTRVFTDAEPDTASIGAQSAAETSTEVDIGANVRTSDSAAMRGRARPNDSSAREGQSPELAKPRVDTVRDTIPR